MLLQFIISVDLRVDLEAQHHHEERGTGGRGGLTPQAMASVWGTLRSVGAHGPGASLSHACHWGLLSSLSSSPPVPPGGQDGVSPVHTCLQCPAQGLAPRRMMVGPGLALELDPTQGKAKKDFHYKHFHIVKCLLGVRHR